jgi:glycosyltransferase involved in cell wall biosynthesis
MKIAVNTRFLLPNKLEGIGWFSYEVLKRWTIQHPEHQFIFIFDRKFDEQFIFSDNIEPVVAFPQARHPFLFYWWFEWSLPAIFKKNKTEAFMSPDGFASLRANIPTQLVIHDIAWQHFPDQVPWMHRKHYEYFMPRFAKKANRIATVSEYSKKDIVQYLGVESDDIDVVYDGSNEAFQPLAHELQEDIRSKYSQGQPYFLYLGSIHPRKNVARLLKAFDQFKKSQSSPLKLLLAGRMAWQTGEIKEILDQLEAKEDIIFLGYVATEELPKLVASAYALTYVSLFEGFGIPLLEALYADVPIITSKTSSMPEVVGEAGLLADPYNIDEIAQQMGRIWQEEGLRSKLIEKGRIQRQKYSWDLTAEKMWDSLLKTIGHV